MRLLNTETLTFTEFFPGPEEPYYILSHTWFKEEPTYHGFLAGRHNLTKQNGAAFGFVDPKSSRDEQTDTSEPPGTTKVIKFCRMARMKNIEWAWIDTCCINKDSSAELSEAINSMYLWYEKAAACYVYLSDVEYEAGHERRLLEEDSKTAFDNADTYGDISVEDSVPQGFYTSRWFRRAWTLQELLAPKNVEFFDLNWEYIGSKSEMARIISEITGIDNEILVSSRPSRLLERYSIGTRMSWAANRESTRVEDRTYSLLGIFGVNMYMLYGEGQNAFYRLQRKLLKTTDDETLLAWSLPYKPDEITFSGILAPHPAAFSDCRRVYRARMDGLPLTVTNNGIRIPVFNVAYANMSNTDIILPLNCSDQAKPGGAVVGVVLTNFHGKWYRRTQVGMVHAGYQFERGSLFSNNSRPTETLVVEISVPIQVQSIRAPVPSQPNELPAVLRFPKHFTSAIVLVRSLDPWELQHWAKNLQPWGGTASEATAPRCPQTTKLYHGILDLLHIVHSRQGKKMRVLQMSRAPPPGPAPAHQGV